MAIPFLQGISIDLINEYTAEAGVSIEGVLLKDGFMSLSYLGSPSADKSITMANRQLKFTWVAPTTASGALELEVTGAFTGDVLHIHQHTGNPGSGTHLVHLEAEDTDVQPLYINSAHANAIEVNKHILLSTIDYGIVWGDADTYLLENQDDNLVLVVGGTQVMGFGPTTVYLNSTSIVPYTDNTCSIGNTVYGFLNAYITNGYMYKTSIGNRTDLGMLTVDRTLGSFTSVQRNVSTTWVDYTATAGSSAYEVLQLVYGTTYTGYIGHTSKYSKIYFHNITNGAGYTLTFQYSKGSGVWGTLSVTDGTSAFTASGTVSFTPPSDWATDTVNGVASTYWVRITTSTTPSTIANHYSIGPDDQDLFTVRRSSHDTYAALKVDKNGWLWFNGPVAHAITVNGNITSTASFATSSGQVNVGRSSTGTTQTAAFYGYANTAATSGAPVQNSPGVYLYSRSWDTDNSVSKYHTMYMLMSAVSSATPYGYMQWINGAIADVGDSTSLMTLDQYGILSTTNYQVLKEISAPAGTPGTGTGFLYIDSSDSKIKFKNDGGTVYDLTFTYSLPATVVQTNQVNTYGNYLQYFESSGFAIYNPAKTFYYAFVGSAIAATRNVTLPLLTGADTFVMEAFTQTLQNKTINATNNTITDSSTAAGDILKSNGTKFVRLARGTALQVLRVNAGGTDLEWGAATAISYGTDYQIPYMNTTDDGFLYSNNFRWTGSQFFVSSSLSIGDAGADPWTILNSSGNISSSHSIQTGQTGKTLQWSGGESSHTVGTSYGGNLTLKGGNQTGTGGGRGGHVYIYGGSSVSSTRGTIYFGDGSSFCTLAINDTETYLVAVDSTTGLLTRRAVSSISGGSTTINNNADNRVITGSNTANTLEGESNLTFDGSTLTSSSGYLAGTAANSVAINTNAIHTTISSTVYMSLQPAIADTGTNVAFRFNTSTSLTSGRKLFTLSNNSTEKFSLDFDGNIILGSTSYTTSVTIKSNMGATASAAAFHFATVNTLSGASSWVTEFYNNTTRVFGVYQDGMIVVGQRSTEPATPPAGNHYIYVDSDDNKLYFKNEDGTLYDLTATGGSSSSMTITEAPSSDHTATGILVSMTAGESLAFGDLVYFKSDGKVWKANANSYSQLPAMGIATTTASANGSVTVLLYGIARDDTWAWTVGGKIYMSTTNGTMSQTAPTGSSNAIQVVGVATHADRMLFNPSYNHLELIT